MQATGKPTIHRHHHRLNVTQTLRADCDQITWTNPAKGAEIHPPPETLAVIVDVVNNRGAMRIFEKEGGEYVDGVGLDDAGTLVIISWNSRWSLRASGVVRIGYASGKHAVT